MKIISISNQKGGVGKTTTSVNLSAGIAREGKRVLLIDLDPQANATSALGEEPESGKTLYGPLVDGTNILDCVQKTNWDNLSLIKSDLELAGADIDLARSGDHLLRLRQVLDPIRNSDDYDYVFLDCPPSLGILMTGALAAADEMLIPLQCEYFGLEGLSKIVNVSNQIRQSGANPNLIIHGILMTMYDSRTNLARQVVADVREHFGEVVYETIIPRSVQLGEAPSFGLPIFDYRSSSRGAKAYAECSLEFLRRQEPPVEE